MLTTCLLLFLVIAGWSQLPPAAATMHRSEIRIRDPFVLADPETKTYHLYSSTTHGMDASEPRKSVVVYKSADGVPYMVFCHEWIQITDGSMDLVRMNHDLSAPVGKPVTLFHAAEADGVRCRADLDEQVQGKRYHAFITDGPWLHRTKTGRLIMLWSSYGPTKYAAGVAVSTSGKIAGPWVQQPAPLWLDDGGHPMLFTTFDGRLVMTIHQPNRRVERARFFEVEDTGETIRIVGGITNAHAPATSLPR